MSHYKNNKYVESWYPEQTETSKFEAQTTLQNYTRFAKACKAGKEIEAFLHEIDVKHVDHQRDITWIELYLIYRIRGYNKPLEDPPILQNRHTLDKQLGAFKELSEARVLGCLKGLTITSKWAKPIKTTFVRLEF